MLSSETQNLIQSFAQQNRELLNVYFARVSVTLFTDLTTFSFPDNLFIFRQMSEQIYTYEASGLAASPKNVKHQLSATYYWHHI